MAERLKAPVLKTGIRETVSGVRIPPSPPLLFIWDNVYNSQKLQHLLKKALGTVCTMPVPSVAAVGHI